MGRAPDPADGGFKIRQGAPACSARRVHSELQLGWPCRAGRLSAGGYPGEPPGVASFQSSFVSQPAAGAPPAAGPPSRGVVRQYSVRASRPPVRSQSDPSGSVTGRRIQTVRVQYGLVAAQQQQCQTARRPVSSPYDGRAAATE